MGNAAPARKVPDEGVAIGILAEDLLGHAIILSLVHPASMADGDSCSVLAAVLQVEKALIEVDCGRNCLWVGKL